MKLLKFRPLGNKKDLERALEIIKTEKFWCSKVWDLNGPTEGIYRNSRFNAKNISETFDGKNSYLICSFSHGDALYTQLLWGYYANGYKGIAIEIDINDRDISHQGKAVIELKNGSKVRKIDYLDELELNSACTIPKILFLENYMCGITNRSDDF